MNLKFEHCCCCIDLRIGCLILGWLGVIVRVATFWLLLAVMDAIEEHETDVTVKGSPVIAVIALIITAVCFVFELLLLVGVYKKKSDYVKAAWVYLMVSAVVYTVLQLFNLNGFAKFFGMLLYFGLEMYFALCVRSYYLVMKGEELEPTTKGGSA